MKFLRVLVLTMLLWIPAAFAAGVTQHDHVTYYINTGETLTAAWDSVEGATSYDMQMLRVEWDNEVVQEWVGITNTQQSFTTPKAGMYTIRVRAVNEDEVSVWATSTDIEFATVDSEPRSWWVYGYTAPPGPIVIDDNQIGP